MTNLHEIRTQDGRLIQWGVSFADKDRGWYVFTPIAGARVGQPGSRVLGEGFKTYEEAVAAGRKLAEVL